MTEPARRDRVDVARIAGAFGLHGEVKVDGADPAEIRAGLAVTALLPTGVQRDLTIAGVRPHQRRFIVRFTGIDDVTTADSLRGARLTASADDLPPLPPNTYRDEDLIGLRVTDLRLGALGEVTGVLHYPHADMLVVGERELLVPMLAAYGVTIDSSAATISTTLPDGFEDLF